MNKKITLLVLAFMAFLFVNAQTEKNEGSKRFSEDEINRSLDESRKEGTQEWEIQIKKRLMLEQMQAEQGGTDNTSTQKHENPNVNLSVCTNPGFESNNVTGWTLTNGNICSPVKTLPCNTCPTTTGGTNSAYYLTTAGATVGSCSENTAGVDNYSGLPIVAPGGGTHSLLLNNACTNGKIQKAKYSFVVSAATNIFTFQYAVVLNSGGHSASQQPYFHVDATDVTANAVIPCTQYDAVAPSSGSLNGWTISSANSSVYWYPWTTISLDLSNASYNGHTIAVSFIVSDCNQCGHFGYCYIDASCNASQITLIKPLCAGGTPAVLQGPPGMASYSWLGPVTGSAQTLTTSVAGSYTLNTTSPTGCPSPSLTYTLNVSPTPTANFSTSAPPCSGNVTFTDGSTISGGGTISNWQWNWGDGSPVVNASSGATQTHSYNPPGTYTVTLKDTSSMGCKNTFTMSVNAGGGGASPGFSSNSPASSPQCLTGNNVTFTNSTTSSGSVTITGYDWDFGDGSAHGSSTTASPNISHSYSASGTYVVTLTVNITGCSSVVTQTVVINPVPVVTVNSPTICPGGTTALTATSTVAGCTFSWTPATYLSATNTNPVNYTAGATNIYTVTATKAGCSGSASSTVTVGPAIVISVNSATICSGASAVLTPTGATTYTWSPAASVTPAIGSPVTANPTSTTVYTVNGSTGSCLGTGTAVVTVNPLPTASFSVPQVCQGTASSFNASASTPLSGSTFNWNFGGAAPNTGSSTSPTITHTYPASGTFATTLTVTTAAGCTATATSNAVVNPFPVIDFTAADACDLSAVNVVNTTGSQGTFTVWAWNFGDGIGTSSSAAPGSYTYPAPGIYTITLSGTVNTGCGGTKTHTVAVHPFASADVFAYLACLGDATFFQDTVVNNVKNPTGLTDNVTSWAWNFGDGQTSTTPDSVYHTYTSCGNYSWSFSLTTSFGCTSTASSTVNVLCLPVVTAPPSLSVCPGVQVPNQNFTTTVNNLSAYGTGGVATSVVFSESSNTNIPAAQSNPGYNIYTASSFPPNFDFDALDAYNDFPTNTSCTNLKDEVYGIAIAGVVTQNGFQVYCIGNLDSMMVTEYPTPTITPVQNIAVCANQQVNVPAFVACPAASTNNWTNSPTSIGLAASGTGNISPFNGTNTTDQPVVATVSVTPTANGCVGIGTSFSITVNPLPTMTVTPDSIYCPKQMINITQNSLITSDPTTGVTWTWNNTNILTGVPASGSSTAPQSYPAATNNTGSNINGIVTYTPVLNGCIGSVVSQTITVKPTPIMNPISSYSYCATSTTTAVPFSSAPADPATTYTYAPNPQLFPPATANSLPSFNLPNVVTTTVLTIDVTPGLNGCIGLPISFSITTFPNPVADFTYSPVCQGFATPFASTSSVSSGIGFSSYSWDFDNNLTVDATTAAPSYTLANAGTNTVNLVVVTNSNPQCKGVITKTVEVYYNPIADVAPIDVKGCPVHDVSFKDASTMPQGAPATSSITAWSYNYGNGQSGNFTSAPGTIGLPYTNSSPTQSTFYAVSVTVTTNNGCVDTTKKPGFIQIYPHPLPGFGWGPAGADIDDPTIVFTDESKGANHHTPPMYGNTGVKYYLGDVFAYNPNSNYEYPVPNSSFSHVYEYYEPYTYYVTQWVENSYGCRDSLTQPVEIKPNFTFYIPNAFSPNSDGTNDGFRGYGVGVDPKTYNLWVYDRWGNMLFYTDDMEKSWDGHLRGNEDKPVLQEDVYVWKVHFKDFTGKKHDYKGTVTLLK